MPARIFCFPHAGGESRTFLAWQPALGVDAELVAVGMPGRGHRADEPPPASIAAFADDVAAEIEAAADRPTYLFGHSLGALVAFEAARRLDGNPMLRHLVASGCSAPSLLPTPRVVRTSKLEGREFAAAAAFFGGLPPEVLATEELLDLFLPSVQADFRLVAGYEYRPAPPLSIPVTLVNGTDDPHVTREALRAWDIESVRPPQTHWTVGGHFYFNVDPEPLLGVLRAIVQADGATAPAVDDHHIEFI